MILAPRLNYPVTTYWGRVLADNPVAFWPMTETAGGVVYDITGHGNTGTVNGSLTMGQSGPPLLGLSQPAFHFDGSSAYISVSTSAVEGLASNGTLSLEVWINPSTLTTTNPDNSGENGPGLFATNNNGGSTGYDWGLKTNGQFWWWPSSGNDRYSTNVLSTNNWYHLVLVVSAGSTVIMYINGIEDSSQSNTGQGAGSFFSIGGPGWIAGYFAGWMCNAAIYNTALSSQQVAAHYATAHTGPVGIS